LFLSVFYYWKNLGVLRDIPTVLTTVTPNSEKIIVQSVFWFLLCDIPFFPLISEPQHHQPIQNELSK